MSNQFAEDAKRIMDFFDNAEQIYNREFKDKGPVTFCLSVLGVDKFDISEVELAADNLNSIVSIISRNLKVEEQDEFLQVARKYIDRYLNWLRAVYNYKINSESSEILFGDDELSDTIVNSIGSAVQVPNNFFSLLSEFTDKKKLPILEMELDNDNEKSNMPTDLICRVDDNIVYIYNDVPWTERNNIWIGDKRNLTVMLSGKYRKVREKFLHKLLVTAYDKFGEDLLFKTIVVDSDVSFRKGSDISIQVNSDNPERFIVVSRGG